MTDDAWGRIESGLQVIRDDVDRQLKRIGRAAEEFDCGDLPRFGPGPHEQLSPARIAELEKEVASLEPWLQGPFVIAENFVIPGLWRNDRRWAWLSGRVGNLEGRRVLDIGSNAGYDPFMFKLKGASAVLACEPFEFIKQARMLESIYRTGVDFQQIGWQDLDPEIHGRFDLVHCHGVLYHEPHPILLLQKLRSMVNDGGEVLLGSMLHASPEHSEYIRFVPDSYAGDRTWWFVPGRLAMRWMLEVTGFEVEELLLSAGPPGEFPTLNGYFSGRPTAPAPALVTPPAFGTPLTRESPGSALAVRLPPPQRAASEPDAIPVRFPPGHYYSPMYDPRELVVEPARSRIWPAVPHPRPGIDWRDAEQRAFMEDVLGAQGRLDFPRDGDPEVGEYYALNGQFPPLDAWILEGLLRLAHPARMIEVGSGFSSLVTARVNREFLGGAMHFTCIEPYPRSFLQAGLEGLSDLVVAKVEDVPLAKFEELQSGDVLFIDTSHVVRTGNDVAVIYGQILPRLQPGVYVHIHDVFLPGDYPEPWVREGWGWNENYVVEAFLQFNGAFDIVLGAQWARSHAPQELARALPGLARSPEQGGASLWLRRRDSVRADLRRPGASTEASSPEARLVQLEYQLEALTQSKSWRLTSPLRAAAAAARARRSP